MSKSQRVSGVDRDSIAMTWNHRVVRRPDPDGSEHFYIHEAYYPSKNVEKADSITMEAIGVHAESVEDLRWVLEKMLVALDKPVLEYDDF